MRLIARQLEELKNIQVPLSKKDDFDFFGKKLLKKQLSMSPSWK